MNIPTLTSHLHEEHLIQSGQEYYMLREKLMDGLCPVANLRSVISLLFTSWNVPEHPSV